MVTSRFSNFTFDLEAINHICVKLSCPKITELENPAGFNAELKLNDPSFVHHLLLLDEKYYSEKGKLSLLSTNLFNGHNLCFNLSRIGTVT